MSFIDEAQASTTATHGVDAVAKLPPAQVREMREAFQVLDRDGDGVVTREDVEDVLTSLGTWLLMPLPAYAHTARCTHTALYTHTALCTHPSPPPLRFFTPPPHLYHAPSPLPPPKHPTY